MYVSQEQVKRIGVTDKWDLWQKLEIHLGFNGEGTVEEQEHLIGVWKMCRKSLSLDPDMDVLFIEEGVSFYRIRKKGRSYGPNGEILVEQPKLHS